MAKKRKKATRKEKTSTNKRSKSQEILLVVTKTKEALKGHGFNVAADALEGLNSVVYWYIDQAAKRAEANGRKTIRSHDFVAG